jgi:hypothetical protein
MSPCELEIMACALLLIIVTMDDGVVGGSSCLASTVYCFDNFIKPYLATAPCS